MSKQASFHEGLNTKARADVAEKAAELFGGKDKPLGEALVSHYGAMAGSMTMTLGEDQAKGLNAQFGGKTKFQANDVVSLGLGENGQIKMAQAQRGGYLLDREGHTTDRLANTNINSSTVMRSGLDKEQFQRDVTTVGSGVNNQGAAQAALSGKLVPHVAQSDKYGLGGQWGLVQDMASGHSGMYNMKGEDIQAAAVRAVVGAGYEAGIFGAKFKTSLEGSLQGASKKAEGVDMVAHVYKATWDAAAAEATGMGHAKSGAKYNEHIAGRLSAMTISLEKEARGQRGYGVGAITSDGPTGGVDKVAPLPPARSQLKVPDMGGRGR